MIRFCFISRRADRDLPEGVAAFGKRAQFQDSVFGGKRSLFISQRCCPLRVVEKRDDSLPRRAAVSEGKYRVKHVLFLHARLPDRQGIRRVGEGIRLFFRHGVVRVGKCKLLLPAFIDVTGGGQLLTDEKAALIPDVAAGAFFGRCIFKNAHFQRRGFDAILHGLFRLIDSVFENERGQRLAHLVRFFRAVPLIDAENAFPANGLPAQSVFLTQFDRGIGKMNFVDRDDGFRFETVR